MEKSGGAAPIGFAKKAYLFLRWPVVLGLLVVSGSFFLVGMLHSLGYQGTTNLRRVDQDSVEWQNFVSSEGTERGKPFQWKNGVEPRVENGKIMFDTRMVRALTYLKNDKGDTCGGKRGHELLELDVSSPVKSDLSVPTWKTRPVSTIYRGVGVRISKADYIKCTIEPEDSSHPELCPSAPTKRTFEKYAIPLLAPDVTHLTAVPPSPGCKITCAVDYYPGSPPVTDPAEANKPTYSTAVTSLVEEIKPFPIQELSSKGAQAGVFKSIQLAVELLNIDSPECENRDGNEGSKRLVPLTLIEPAWVVKKLGNSWDKMIETAKVKLPYNFQTGSPLAGLCADELLDLKGFHFNY